MDALAEIVFVYSFKANSLPNTQGELAHKEIPIQVMLILRFFKNKLRVELITVIKKLCSDSFKLFSKLKYLLFPELN